jgi:transposase InsO family protein
MQFKFDVFSKFQIYKLFVKSQIKKQIKILHSNNDDEYKFVEFKKFFDEHDIQHQFSTPYTPQQNGIVEGKDCILMESPKFAPINQTI